MPNPKIERNLIIILFVVIAILVIVKAVRAADNPWESLGEAVIEEATPEVREESRYVEEKMWPVYIKQTDDLGNTYWKMYYTNFLYKPGEIGSPEIIFKGPSYGK